MKTKDIKTGLSFLIILLSNSVFCQLNHYAGHEAYEDDEYECKCIIDPKLPEFIFTLCIDTESHGVSRIEIKHPNSDKIIQTLKIPVMFMGFNPNEFDTLDMNFDGYPDIRLMYSSASGGADFHVWLYIQKTGKFKYNNELSSLSDPIIDYNAKTLTSCYANGACCGTQTTYRFEGGKLVLVREESTERTDKDNVYVNTVTMYKNNKIISVKIDTLKEK